MKLLISESFYSINSMMVRYKGKFDFRKLKEDGILVIPNFIESQEASLLKNLIDLAKPNQTDELGSDNRIFGLKSPILKKIDNEILPLYKKYISALNCDHFWMGNKVTYKPNNLGSGGGWHRDSLNRRQLKFMIYLNDVSENNGPFEYYRGSHSLMSKIKFGFKHFDWNPRLDNDIIFNLDHSKKVVASGDSGTLVIFDSSGIHRGRPLINGERYAITKYLYDTGIPKQVLKVLNYE